MKGIACLAIVALLVMVELFPANSQTFQYSRGWTNGRKRSNGQASAAEQLAMKVLQLAWPNHDSRSMEQFNRGCRYPKLCLESSEENLNEKRDSFQHPSSSNEDMNQ